MKNIIHLHSKLGAIALWVIAAASAHAITFVQWPSSAGGNDHFYGITDNKSDWNVAEVTAVSFGGHLVSITSDAEQSFVASTFLTGQFATLPLWIGLTDIPNGVGSRNYTTWTTGELLVYINWNTNTGEPNNAPPGEDYGAINWHSSYNGTFGTWNDTPLNGTSGYGGNTDGPYYGIVEIIGPPPPSNLLNISTRLNVQTGDQVLIGGFVITGTDPKMVLIRGIGPSLTGVGVTLSDPTLELHQGSMTVASNDNWKINDQTGQSQQAAVEATTVPPTNDLESAILVTLSPGAYTAILAGKNGGTGVGLVDVYDLGQGANSKLANISTRGFVNTGNNVMIGGFIVGGGGGGTARVMVRALGPSLTGSGVAGALGDPTLELHDGSGTTIATNDNWKTRPDGSSQQAEIEATTIPPTNDLESALVQTLPPGNYTAIVSGKGNTTGVGLVEAYKLQAMTYDLKADWSDSSNPNGVWSYNERTNPLPFQPSWGNAGSFTGVQPAWAHSAGTDPTTDHTYIPAWFRLSATPTSALDLQTGDVGVHTWSQENGIGLGPGNVTWTSPIAGTVDLSGSVWEARDIGRSNHWSLTVNGTVVTEGDISAANSSRSSPFDFTLGTGGAGALNNIPVSAGEVIKLQFDATTPSTGFGDLAGVNFTVNLQ